MNFMTASEQTLVAAAAETITFTLLTVQNPAAVGKSFWIDDVGEVQTSTEGRIAAATAERIEVMGLTQLAAFFRTLTPGKHVIMAGVAMETPLTVVPGYLLSDRAGAVARTNDTFPFKRGVAMLMLDYDPGARCAVLDLEGFYTALEKAVPALADYQSLWTPSTSSEIMTTEGEVVRDLKGQRTYLIAANGTDIPRALDVLHKRFWLAGHGRIQVSGSGTLLERSLVDLGMKQSAKLDYAAAGPVLGEGLVRTNEDPFSLINEAGIEVVDTLAVFPDLTPEEDAECQRLVAAAKEDAAPEAAAQKERWLDGCLGKEAKKQGVSVAVLEAKGRRQELKDLSEKKVGGVLSADHLLYLSAREVVTVREVLADPLRFHGMALCDPLEEDYRGYHKAATLFSKDRKLFSHAHGLNKTYILGTDDEWRDIFVQHHAPPMDKQSALITAIEVGTLDLMDDKAINLAVALGFSGQKEMFDRLEAVARKQHIVRKWRAAVKEVRGDSDAAAKDEQQAQIVAAMEELPGVDVGEANANMRAERMNLMEQRIGASELAFSFAGLAMKLVQRASPMGEEYVRDEKGEKVLDEDGRPVTKPVLMLRPEVVTAASVAAMMHETHHFYRQTSGGKLSEASAPAPVVAAMTARMGEHLKPLAGVSTHPVWFRGKLLTGRGYDTGSKLYLNTPDIKAEGFSDAAAAYSYLVEDLMADFPFEDETDAAAAVALGLTLLAAKGDLAGETGPPLFTITSTAHNSGKSLLAALWAEVVLGTGVPTQQFPEDREELRKLLDTAVITSTSVLMLDNLKRGFRLGNSYLDAFITAGPAFSGRVLGLSKSFTGSADTVVVATGNALVVGGDTQSRTVAIRLAPDPDQNRAAREYRHRDLLGYARKNRGKAVGALAAIFAEKSGARMFGRFPRWADVVAAPLAAASGINLTERWKEQGENDDGDVDDMTAVCADIERLQSAQQTEWITAAEVVSSLKPNLLAAMGVRGEMDEAASASKVSYALFKNSGARGVRHGDYLLIHDEKNLGDRTGRKKRRVFQILNQPKTELPKW